VEIAMRCGAVVLFAIFAGAAAAETGTGLNAQERRGEALLARLCAECHAIGLHGASPRAEAPPFRILGQRYKIEALEEALAEGLTSGHPDMPDFRFSAREVGDVIAYLNAIQSR
jgi:mono/diheme cytochrome c family protein